MTCPGIRSPNGLKLSLLIIYCLTLNPRASISILTQFVQHVGKRLIILKCIKRTIDHLILFCIAGSIFTVHITISGKIAYIMASPNWSLVDYFLIHCATIDLCHTYTHYTHMKHVFYMQMCIYAYHLQVTNDLFCIDWGLMRI